MASQVDIANKALSILGAARITAITDNTKSARAISAHWDMVRRAEIRKHFWAFALKRDALPALADAPAWGFDTAYQLPADFLRLFQINDTFVVPAQTDYRTMDDSAWAIEGGAVLCNFGAPLKIRYVRDIMDTASFDPLFADVMAARLAYDACEEITNSTNKQAAAGERYKQCLNDAVRANSIERPPSGILDDSWMVARL